MCIKNTCIFGRKGKRKKLMSTKSNVLALKKYIRMYMNHVSSQNKDRGATFSSYVKMMVSSESLYTPY